MGGKKPTENSKKAAGNARKADAAAQKKAVEDSKKAAEEDAKWSKGSKSNAKKDDAEAKRADAARKKAERDALLAAEEASQPAKAKGANAKTAQKKTRGTLDLSQLDDAPAGRKGTTLNASGIDNALDALSLTGSTNNDKIDRHPERRFKAAYAAYEARRLPEIEEEYKGLRRQQRIDIIKKEFEKSEENPFNQAHVAFDASREEIAAVKDAERKKVEARLGSK
ncbi:hypothetical protein ASPZODRAFT_59646 [Penicilliopsis zonata CBS 506.65]|uniref:DUF1014 domain protein n=1 Tax=Penicilliopsis zonata CBS 506.65 TaxID=1073090 RepID=A0A1L9SSH2_9EURO|nr:hypothetical protein ASPZODRAFT_59646 [Penicilliopsis zonata CBS 506.65]OJJ50056.1 hypothetical protein ASPZODRAFT_59646 [Penicilliopsis zonata CBS 506.65]